MSHQVALTDSKVNALPPRKPPSVGNVKSILLKFEAENIKQDVNSKQKDQARAKGNVIRHLQDEIQSSKQVRENSETKKELAAVKKTGQVSARKSLFEPAKSEPADDPKPRLPRIK